MEGEQLMAKAGKHGVTSKTPKNIEFGAATVHKNVDLESLDLDSTIIGATSGGSKVTITPEFTPIEVDGALVKVKGLIKKTGEAVLIEINFIELSKDIIKSAIVGKDGTTSNAAYDLIESKANIEAGDYLENICLAGQTVDGTNIIFVAENVLCTSGFELETKNKEAGVVTLTFECHADVDSDLDTLPYHIFYPKTTA